MRSAYNYTLVERHKQKLYIPYVGLEFSGWTMLVCMLLGVLLGMIVIGMPLSLIFGDFAYVIALVITAVIETVVVTLVTEIDRESGKNKLLTIYYRSVKRYQLIYDDKGKRHYLSKKKRGVIYHVC